MTITLGLERHSLAKMGTSTRAEQTFDVRQLSRAPYSDPTLLLQPYRLFGTTVRRECPLSLVVVRAWCPSHHDDSVHDIEGRTKDDPPILVTGSEGQPQRPAIGNSAERLSQLSFASHKCGVRADSAAGIGDDGGTTSGSSDIAGFTFLIDVMFG